MSWETDLEGDVGDLEDFLVVEDLDLADETELRRVVASVESLLNSSAGAGNIGLRVSVLTLDQWQTVLNRVLPESLKRGGADRFIHTFKDPKDKNHLLVSPSVVSGINEGSQAMYQELVYASLRSIPTNLPKALRLGVDDVLASAISKDIRVKLYCNNNPFEMDLVKSILKSLSYQYGYKPLDWALIMRRRPDRFMLVLRKSNLLKSWVHLGEKEGLEKNVDFYLKELEKDQINYNSKAMKLFPKAVSLARKIEAKK
jgi:hypothetical protein